MFFRYPDCTKGNGFTSAQFEEVFCSGLLGQTDGSLDRQCQKRTGWSDSTACDVSYDYSFMHSFSRLLFSVIRLLSLIHIGKQSEESTG